MSSLPCSRKSHNTSLGFGYYFRRRVSLLPRMRLNILLYILLLLCLRTTAVAAAADQEVTPALQQQNSTIACTRGLRQTRHRPDCRPTDGRILIQRLFYVAVPKESECDRTASYEQCCTYDPDGDCVFESDFRLSDFESKCNGNDYCSVQGRPVNSARGFCNLTLYSDITSISFVEFLCINSSAITDICPEEPVVKENQQFYLDTNNFHDNQDSQSECSCVLYTECGATLSFQSVVTELKVINSTECVEEVIFRDLKEPGFNKSYTCLNQDENIYNSLLFTSQSNAASFRLDILGSHEGKFLVGVSSSRPNATVKIKCGHGLSLDTESLDPDFYCPGEVTPSTTSSSTTTTTSPGVTSMSGETSEPTNPHTTSTDSGGGGSSGATGSGGGGGSQTDTSPSPTETQAPPEPLTSSSDNLHPGAIAGIVLACIGIFIVVVYLLILYTRRQKDRKKKKQRGSSYREDKQRTHPAQAQESSTPGEFGDEARIFGTDKVSNSGQSGISAMNPVYFGALDTGEDAEGQRVSLDLGRTADLPGTEEHVYDNSNIKA